MTFWLIIPCILDTSRVTNSSKTFLLLFPHSPILALTIIIWTTWLRNREVFFLMPRLSVRMTNSLFIIIEIITGKNITENVLRFRSQIYQALWFSLYISNSFFVSIHNFIFSFSVRLHTLQISFSVSPSYPCINTWSTCIANRMKFYSNKYSEIGCALRELTVMMDGQTVERFAAKIPFLPKMYIFNQVYMKTSLFAESFLMLHIYFLWVKLM